MGQLYGRGKVIEFVKSALKCKDIRNRPLPILLLTGPRGSGGSALLARLWEEIGDDSPCARLDLANAEEVPDVLLAAMQGLLRNVIAIRQLRFPRLRLAVKALSFVDDGRGRTGFDTHMQAGRRAVEASSTLVEWTDRVAPLLHSPEHQVFAKLAARLSGEALVYIGRRSDKTSRRWFAEQNDVGGGQGFEPLWRLYCWHKGQDENGNPLADDQDRAIRRDRADKTLCDAFLTDMRTDYNDTGLRHARRTRNPCLLLDNADSRSGRRLLELIEACRRESGRNREPADPLLVVPVQHHPPAPEAGKPVEAAKPDEGTEDDLDFGRWRAKSVKADYLILWCPVRLSALGTSDVVEMTASRLLGRIHHDADFIRSLTGGHPEATTRLTALLKRLDSPIGLPSLLDHPVPPELRDQWMIDKADTTVGDHLLRHAFADILWTLPDGGMHPDSIALLDAMAAVAATPGFRLGAWQAALDYWRREEVTAVDALDRLTETMWWTEPGDGEPGGLHPLAALLLRHWLARDPVKWADVHEGYVTHYRDMADAALRYRHKLALVAPEAGWMDTVPDTGGAGTDSPHSGDLHEVVMFLDRKWETHPDRDSEPGSGRDTGLVRRRTQAWLDVLNTVVTAPNRLRTTHRPEALVKELAGPAEPGSRHQVIARLAVARWLFNDRLFDPRHRLARVVADEYHFLAQLPGGDGDLLLEEEARYRKIQREWEG